MIGLNNLTVLSLKLVVSILGCFQGLVSNLLDFYVFDLLRFQHLLPSKSVVVLDESFNPLTKLFNHSLLLSIDGFEIYVLSLQVFKLVSLIFEVAIHNGELLSDNLVLRIVGHAINGRLTAGERVLLSLEDEDNLLGFLQFFLGVMKGLLGIHKESIVDVGLLFQGLHLHLHYFWIVDV